MNQERSSAQPVVKMSRWQGALRASWLYPIRGIGYFSTHRFLWPLFKARLLPCLLLSIATFTILFVWAYLPQALLLVPFHGRAAFFNAFILVLGEGATITALLFEAFFVDGTLANIFDAVLIAHDCTALVSGGREVRPATESSDPVGRLGSPDFNLVYSPFSFKQICEFILLLPLNFVPYVGVPCFLLLTGARGGPLHHHRYFRLRGLKKKERRAEIASRRLKYTWFGTVALALQLVPGLSMLFLMTTAAGSALWVADLEHARRELGEEPRLEEGASQGAESSTRAYGTAENEPLLEQRSPK